MDKYIRQSLNQIIMWWEDGGLNKKKEKKEWEGLLQTTMEEIRSLHGVGSSFKEIEGKGCYSKEWRSWG